MLSLASDAAVEPDAPSGGNDADTTDAASFDADDGAAGDAADASSTDAHDASLARERTVFATSIKYNGDLGGVAGADAKCQVRADASSLATVKGRIFRAWLSTSTESPSTRLLQGTAAYKLPNGVLLATNWSDLVDGALYAQPKYDENSVDVNSAVWTATNAIGALQGSTCNDWSNGTSAASGDIGSTYNQDPGWTRTTGAEPCDALSALYCIEE